jgi:DNA-binding LacI/PurR family transcriptional regulator
LAGLEQDGLVKRIHGKGTFVCDEAPGQLYQAQDLFALILPETETAFYPSLQRSFESAAAALHNQVVVCNSHNDVDKQASAILQLIDLRVAGVAIVPPTVTATPAFHIRQLQKHDIPVVCCSRSVPGTRAPLLGIPFEAVGQLAGERIGQAGHRRVALVSTSRSTATTAYEQGLRKALGQAVEVQSFVSSCTRPTDYTQVAAECNAWLDRVYADAHGPTAIFCGFDSLAESLYMLLAQRGLRVPQDVSLVGFGGTHRGGGLSAHLSSVTIDEVGMGHQAIDLLARMRRGALPIDAGENRDIPLDFNSGSTLAPPPAKST